MHEGQFRGRSMATLLMPGSGSSETHPREPIGLKQNSTLDKAGDNEPPELDKWPHDAMPIRTSSSISDSRPLHSQRSYTNSRSLHGKGCSDRDHLVSTQGQPSQPTKAKFMSDFTKERQSRPTAHRQSHVSYAVSPDRPSWKST